MFYKAPHSPKFQFLEEKTVERKPETKIKQESPVSSSFDLNDEEKWVLFSRGDFYTSGLYPQEKPRSTKKDRLMSDITIELKNKSENQTIRNHHEKYIEAEDCNS
ncbi:hypothetical protein RF11_01609 [Thelohanellus kitauei]|uniref:Uncharacterized protein n=1 Tax=Thelohanellus kitauei TaxID=669202 RepID=A0A0C2MS92_THEKT|nr:hypothetical protein RF11_01609 [Thelohanellus kitauei]